jgi:hypothetical protein
MKKFFVIFFLFCAFIFAQDDYVPVGHPIYDFLDRMEALHFISGYNSFELPKPRQEIAYYLKEIIKHKNELNNVDYKMLQDFETEFEFSLYGTLKNSEAILDSGGYDLFSQKSKYLYFYNKPGKANLFVNLIGEGDLINQKVFADSSRSGSSALGIIGGQIEGTFLDHFGFVIKGTDGDVLGNRQVAKLRPDIAENFKYNLDPAAAFFDETSGYLTADYDMFRIKLGRDKMQIGYGPVKSIIDDIAPTFDYLGFNINYDFFTFSYFHAKILGTSYFQPDSINGGINVVPEKYLGYHRIGFNLSDNFNFGVGEMIIYGDRSIDLSYLNPFAFYKSVEHANQDRDNSFLFFDVNNKSIKGLKFYSTLLIDDIDFGKLGTGWYGNQTLFDFGIYSANLYDLIPLYIKLEYTKIDPYVHTHRTGSTNFTSDGYNLGSFLQPNSELFLAELDYQLNYRTSITANFSYVIHGANPILPDGTIINVGGDENLGHRVFDSNTVRFLDGDLEYSRIFTGTINYEPFKQIYLNLKLMFLNEALQNSVINKQLQSYFTVSVLL